MNCTNCLSDLLQRRTDDHSTSRSHRVRLAVISSGLSKITALLLQGVALPLVYHSLGTHQYALYLLITGALATLTLMQLGVGPGLSQAIARQNAVGNKTAESGAFAAATCFITATSLVAGAIIYFALQFIPSGTLFGANYAQDQVEVVQAGHVAIALLVATIIFSVVDAALAGYQEQVDTNLGLCAANLASTLALVIVCLTYAPSMQLLLLIMYGMPLLARGVNLLILLRRRPYLYQGFLHMDRGQLLSMGHVGGAFWVIQITGLLEQQGGIFLVARLAPAAEVALFGIVFRAINMASSVVGMFTQSLWPALTDAVARNDLPWIVVSIQKIKKYLMLFAIVAAVLLAVLGQKAIELIWHIPLQGQYLLVLFLSLYIIANIWTHLHYVILIGLHRVGLASLVSCGENALMIGIGILLTKKFGALGMAESYLLASLILPSWLLVQYLQRELGELSSPKDMNHTGLT